MPEESNRDDNQRSSTEVAAEDLALSNSELPEFVFVPSERVVHEVAESTRIELREVENGGHALLTYSSPTQLVENCGPHQPWVAFPVDRVEDLLHQTGADVAVLNAPLAPELWHEAEAG